MEKSFEVTKTFYTRLFCDKCGKEMMNFYFISSSTMPYKYMCECGFEIATSNSYPYQRMEVDVNPCADK